MGIHESIATIKQLRAELEQADDKNVRQAIRERIAKAIKEKERGFRNQARTDEDDSSFIHLLN